MGIPFKQYLYGAIVFSTVLIGLLHFWIFGSPETAMQEFGVLSFYFSFVVWAGGQLWLIRIRERSESKNPVADGPDSNTRLDETALLSAETYLDMGETIDTVCAMVEPRFPDWNRSRREQFRMDLMAAVQERRLKAQDREPA
jgi:hypothetical protein